MVKVQRLHAELKRRLNRIFSDYDQHISVVDVDAYLNQAKEVLLENYSVIVEKNRTLADRLRSLEIKNLELKKVSESDKSTIFKLPEDHYTTLSRRAKGKPKYCENIDDIFVNNIFTLKEQESLRDSNVTPDFNWRETFSNEDHLGLHVYHNNKFEITNAYIDYLKWIPDVAFVSGTKNGLYINQDGDSITEDKHLLLDDKILWIKIVDIAEYLIKKNFEQDYRSTIDTILFNERIYINNQ